MTGRQHGTKTRYNWGPGEDGTPGKGCRCEACRRANRDYENRRSRQIHYGRWEPFVDAGRAREHVRMLGRHGIGAKRAAALAGVPSSMVSRLLYGGPGDRPPAKRIRPGTEAAILAVRPALDTLGGAVHVDAAGTRRRVQALVWCGWTQARIAAALGMLHSNFSQVMRRDRVTAATARAMRELYDELWDQPPPGQSHAEKVAASRARNYARACGWAPPLAWDEDTIDDPAASPGEWERPAGRRWRTRDLVAEAAELAALGLDRNQAAERLGVSRNLLDKAIERARKAA
jgi:transcriptional regulator with XRE-family HTH domain